MKKEDQDEESDSVRAQASFVASHLCLTAITENPTLCFPFGGEIVLKSEESPPPKASLGKTRGGGKGKSFSYSFM